MSRVDLLAPPNAAAVAEAVRAYTAALRERYGDRLRGIYLFGSRARGDFEPYSDVDIALILASDGRHSLGETRALSDLAYDVFLDTGAQVQPWPFTEREWHEPGLSESSGLIRSIKRDARPVWVKS